MTGEHLFVTGDCSSSALGLLHEESDTPARAGVFLFCAQIFEWSFIVTRDWWTYDDGVLAACGVRQSYCRF